MALNIAQQRHINKVFNELENRRNKLNGYEDVDMDLHNTSKPGVYRQVYFRDALGASEIIDTETVLT